MKKSFYLLGLLLIANFIFIGCSSDEDLDPITQMDEGVVILGTRWATRNVDRPGHFAATPESIGMVYQWNRRTAFPADEGEYIANTAATGTAWERRNDPCPPGWRVPTRTEMERLIGAASSRWINQEGVYGQLFGLYPNQIFLPARSFHRDMGNGEIHELRVGMYWGSTQSNRDTAHGIGFAFNNAPRIVADWERIGLLSIRCVAR